MTEIDGFKDHGMPIPESKLAGKRVGTTEPNDVCV